MPALSLVPQPRTAMPRGRRLMIVVPDLVETTKEVPELEDDGLELLNVRLCELYRALAPSFSPAVAHRHCDHFRRKQAEGTPLEEILEQMAAMVNEMNADPRIIVQVTAGSNCLPLMSDPSATATGKVEPAPLVA